VLKRYPQLSRFKKKRYPQLVSPKVSPTPIWGEFQEIKKGISNFQDLRKRGYIQLVYPKVYPTPIWGEFQENNRITILAPYLPFIPY
jgi:hypothetical protein